MGSKTSHLFSFLLGSNLLFIKVSVLFSKTQIEPRLQVVNELAVIELAEVSKYYVACFEGFFLYCQ
jgi:hypothetical protein